jgi:hypothetical protein
MQLLAARGGKTVEHGLADKFMAEFETCLGTFHVRHDQPGIFCRFDAL